MCRVSSLLIITLALAAPIAAQTTANGTLRGTVRDQQGAVLSGATVSAESATVPGIYRTTTNEQGHYRLVDVPPGDYRLIAELAGFNRFVRPSVTVRAGLTIDVNITLQLGPIEETIEVSVETPLLETRSGGQAVSVSGELLRAMPLSERREWFGALTLAPGVTTAEWVNREKLLFVHGADSNANVVQLDGADMTGALAQPLRYLSLPSDAIDDIQIKTAGVDATAPLGLGGIVTIATTSGTNALKGTATLFVQPRTWNDSNVPDGTSSTIDQTQLDLSAGAPIVRDRLWAFGSYRYQDVSTGASRTAAQLEALRGLVPGFTPFDNTNVAHFWFVKLNARASDAHQLTGFYQSDVNPVTFADPVTERSRSEATGGAAASARLSSIWSQRLTTRLGASYNDKRRDGRNEFAAEPLERVYQGTILSAGRLVGNGRLVDRGSPTTGWSTQPNSKLTLYADATLFIGSWFGSHDVQMGTYAQPRIQVELRDYLPNGGFVFLESVLRQPGNYSAGVTPFRRSIFDGDTLTRLRRRGKDYAAYVQDTWRPTAQLSITAGLRIDRIIWTDQLFETPSHRSTEAGPRFGLNYALTPGARHIVRAHWVRVHDQPASTGTSAGTSTLGSRDEYDLNLDGTFETTLVSPATFAITPNRSISPDLHQPFVEEWGAGYNQQLGGGLTARLDVVHRGYKDRTTLVETNGRYEGSAFVGYADEKFNEIYQVTNNRWNWPVYTSLETAVTKRTARVQGIASYVRQWRHIAGTWQPHDPASVIQPAAFANNRAIGSPTGSTSTPIDANSLSGSHMTQRATASAQWQDHVVRAGVTYTGPWNLVLATNYTFQSGAWSGPIVTRIPAADPAFGPTTVRLSNGRTVTNPLATTLRFARPTRGEGQLKTPRLHVWNLRVARAINWRRLKIDAGLDVFNVTNNDADASFETGANQTFNPLYGITTYRQLPRSAQAILRVAF